MWGQLITVASGCVTHRTATQAPCAPDVGGGWGLSSAAAVQTAAVTAGIDLSLAGTSFSARCADRAPSPHSPTDTHFLGSGTHRRVTGYENLAQDLTCYKQLLNV